MPMRIRWSVASALLASLIATAGVAAAAFEPQPVWGVRYIVEFANFELLRINREEWSRPFIDRSGRLMVVGTRSGILEARDLARGEIQWSKRDVGNVGAEMEDWRGAVLLGLDSDLVALDEDDGRERWRIPLDGRLSGPIAREDDLAVVPIRPNGFVAVDLDAAEIIWRQKRPTPDDLTVRGQAGAWIDARRDLAALGFSDGTLLGVSLKTGEIRWVVRLGEAGEFFRDVDTTPIAVDDGRSLMVASYNAGIYKVDAERGSLVYERPIRRVHGAVRAEPLDLLVLSTGDGEVVGFDPGPGTVRWRYLVNEGFPTAPVAAGDGQVFVGTSKGALSLVDGRTGAPQQLVAPGSGTSVPPMVRGDDAVALSNKAMLLVFGKHRGNSISGVLPEDPGPAEDFGRRHEQ
jgi:hypothetical protein